jgi:uncharacterized protein with NRDE domain
MCLIAVALRADIEFPLIVAANRDEYFDRPAEPARWWEEAANLLAGRDVQRGGTWFGVTRAGRIAMVTNFREPPSGPRAPSSRGELVTEYLRADVAPGAYLNGLMARRRNYDAFNLLVGDTRGLWYLGHREPSPRLLGAGVHALSNGEMNAPWPKVRKAREALQRALVGRRPGAVAALQQSLLSMLADPEPAPETELPNTGVGPEWERRLSPVFVHADGYGTRCSTVLVVRRDGAASFHERTYGRDGRPAGDAIHEFRLEAA